MATFVAATSSNCRWWKKECPCGTCREDVGVDCKNWTHKPTKIKDNLKGERDCCGTIYGSEHRITCHNSKHKYARWRGLEPASLPNIPKNEGDK